MADPVSHAGESAQTGMSALACGQQASPVVQQVTHVP